MDKSDEEAAPQLSGDGAKLLADVLSKRADDRHDTLAAQRNARRREADSLRSAPAQEPTQPRADGESTSVLAGKHERPHDEGRLMQWVLLVAIGVAAGFCFLLATSLEARPARTVDVEIVEVDGSNEPSEPVAEPEVLVPDSDDLAIAQQLPVTPVASISPNDIEVTVYDAAPSNGDIYSFALRIKSVSLDEELYTGDLVVRVEGEFGEPATTFSRFIHDTLPVGSSALATVRAENASSGQQYVVVWFENAVIARVAIESAEPLDAADA